MKLSQLSKEAADCCAILRRDKRYAVVHPGDFHVKGDGGKTLVNAAGAFAAVRLGARHGIDLIPDAFSDKWAVNLDAIDHMASGRMVQALETMGLINGAADNIPMLECPEETLRAVAYLLEGLSC